MLLACRPLAPICCRQQTLKANQDIRGQWQRLLKATARTMSTQTASCRLISTAAVAKPLESEIKAKVAQMPTKPRLVGFLANHDPSAKVYADWTARTCTETGLRFELRSVPRTELEDHIDAANEDPDVNGILVYYPVFGGGQDGYLQNCVNPMKDVEGLSHFHRYIMYGNISARSRKAHKDHPAVWPCTPLAIMKMLDYAGVARSQDDQSGMALTGKIVTIVNRSEIVGRPLASLLANDGACVYSVNKDDVIVYLPYLAMGVHRTMMSECSLSMNECLSQSDLVIAGVPHKDFKIDSQWLKPGVVCVNFASHNNFDANVREKASLFMKQPGKVTVTMLQQNLLMLSDTQKAFQSSAANGK